MFFGLTNSPATLQTMMDGIFEELIMEGIIVVYLDDILIFTKTAEEHQEIVQRVLCIFQTHGLSLKPEKCKFEKTSRSSHFPRFCHDGPCKGCRSIGITSPDH
jgi:hypothetical protein